MKEGAEKVELAQLAAVGDGDLGPRFARVTSVTLDSLAKRTKERKVRVRATWRLCERAIKQVVVHTLTTSMPLVTLPKTTCLPSSHWRTSE